MPSPCVSMPLIDSYKQAAACPGPQSLLGSDEQNAAPFRIQNTDIPSHERNGGESETLTVHVKSLSKADEEEEEC